MACHALYLALFSLLAYTSTVTALALPSHTDAAEPSNRELLPEEIRYPDDVIQLPPGGSLLEAVSVTPTAQLAESTPSCRQHNSCDSPQPHRTWTHNFHFDITYRPRTSGQHSASHAGESILSGSISTPCPAAPSTGGPSGTGSGGQSYSTASASSTVSASSLRPVPSSTHQYTSKHSKTTSLPRLTTYTPTHSSSRTKTVKTTETSSQHHSTHSASCSSILTNRPVSSSTHSAPSITSSRSHSSALSASHSSIPTTHSYHSTSSSAIYFPNSTSTALPTSTVPTSASSTPTAPTPFYPTAPIPYCTWSSTSWVCSQPTSTVPTSASSTPTAPTPFYPTAPIPYCTWSSPSWVCSQPTQKPPIHTRNTIPPHSSIVPVPSPGPNACQKAPKGTAPITRKPRDDALSFQKNPLYAAYAHNATLPPSYTNHTSGYTRVYAAQTTIPQSVPVLWEGVLPSYSAQACAAKCDRYDRALAPRAAELDSPASCVGFGVWVERDPAYEPSQTCRDPPSTANFRCALYGAEVGKGEARSWGQWREGFQVVVAGSNGYVKKSAIEPVSQSGTNGTEATAAKTSPAARKTEVKARRKGEVDEELVKELKGLPEELDQVESEREVEEMLNPWEKEARKRERQRKWWERYEKAYEKQLKKWQYAKEHPSKGQNSPDIKAWDIAGPGKRERDDDTWEEAKKKGHGHSLSRKQWEKAEKMRRYLIELRDKFDWKALHNEKMKLGPKRRFDLQRPGQYWRPISWDR